MSELRDFFEDDGWYYADPDAPVPNTPAARSWRQGEGSDARLLIEKCVEALEKVCHIPWSESLAPPAPVPTVGAMGEALSQAALLDPEVALYVAQRHIESLRANRHWAVLPAVVETYEQASAALLGYEAQVVERARVEHDQLFDLEGNRYKTPERDRLVKCLTSHWTSPTRPSEYARGQRWYPRPGAAAKTTRKVVDVHGRPLILQPGADYALREKGGVFVALAEIVWYGDTRPPKGEWFVRMLHEQSHSFRSA